MPSVHRVVMDTDIGSDVDDALALALALGREEIDLAGVVTVYGDTTLRARIARRYLELAGRSDVDVVPGSELPRSGREVWWPGHEGTGHSELERQQIRQDVTGPAFLSAAIAANPGEVDLVAIAPLTNVASALDLDPGFERGVRRIVIMGGAFDRAEIEHNIVSDIDAASRVFSSAASITVLPLDVTERIRLSAQQVDLIADSGPVGRQLATDIRQWLHLRGTAWNVPHDPLTILAITDPELFELSAPGRVTVDPISGSTSFEEGVNGSTRIVTDLDVDRVTSLMVEGIRRASRARLR